MTSFLPDVSHGTASALGVDPQAAHARLGAILARGEFVHVHEPGLLATLWNWVLSWMWRSFGRVSAVGGRSEWVGRIFWGLLAAAGLAGLLWWLGRRRRRQGAAVRAEPAPTPPSAHAGDQWRAEALRLAALLDWRGAIGALYWGAATRLEGQLRWGHDQARTPRERLRLLPAASPARGDFALLTRSFEQFWYGHGTAEAYDFEAARACFARLEAH